MKTLRYDCYITIMDDELHQLLDEVGGGCRSEVFIVWQKRSLQLDIGLQKDIIIKTS